MDKSIDSINGYIERITKGTLVIFVGSFIGKIFRFVLYVVLGRFLGPASYGIYALGQSIVDIVTYIGSLGDGRGMIRFGSVYLAQKNIARLKALILEFLGSSLAITIVISCGIFIFSRAIASVFMDKGYFSEVLKLFSFGIPFYVFSIATTAVAVSFHKMTHKVIIQELCQPVFNILIVMAFFIVGFRLKGAVTAFVISSAVTAVVGCVLIIKLFPELISSLAPRWNPKKLLTYSIPIILIVSSHFLLFKMDRIVLGIFRTASEVGVYSAASSVAMYMFIFNGVFEASFSPLMAQLYHNNRREELRKIYSLVALWGIRLAFIPALCLIIFSQEILGLFGKGFIMGSTVLVILTIVFFIEIIPGQIKQLFQMSSKQNIEFINAVSTIILNLCLNFLCIPLWGMIGAAAATFVSLAVISIFRLIQIKRTFGFSPFSSRHKMYILLFIGGILFALWSLAQWNLSMRIIGAFALFMVFMVVCYRQQSDDDRIIGQVLKGKWSQIRMRV